LKRLPLYPFLFILYIVLTPLAHNLDQLDPFQALRPLIVLWLAAAGGLLLFYILFRDWQYAGYLVFLVTLFFLAFGHLNRLVQDQLSNFNRALDERIFLAICAGFLGLFAIKGVWARLGGHTWLAPYLNLVIAIGLLFPIYRLFLGFVHEPLGTRNDSRNTQTHLSEKVLDCSNTPDIYYIVLDGYGRADVLADLYGLDNQPFLEYLRRNGFYVAIDSYTNYIQLVFSIPSGLNINYIDPPGKGVSGQAYYSGLISHDDIMATLKRCGYQTVSIESGFSFTNRPEVDVYLARGIISNEFESLLLADSPVDVIATELNFEPSEFSFEAHRQRVLYSFEKLSMLH
jgi:hypothetical protein